MTDNGTGLDTGSVADLGEQARRGENIMTTIPPNRIRPRLLVTIVLVLLVAGCDDGGPVAPSAYPQVAGTYSGPLALKSSLAAQQSLTLTGQMRMVVVQDGAELTITASITFFGETTEQPPITGTIDEAGSFTLTSGEFSSTEADPECGMSTLTGFTLMFSGSTAGLNVTFTSDCGTATLDGDLTR